jgi:Transposase
MDYFAGLDVSVKETSVCILDDTGKIVRETRVASEPEALLQVLTNTIYRFKRVGLEAGPLSQWLYSVLAEAGLPVICVETRHMRAVLKAQINKTDRNDARGLAQMMRVGLYRPVHVKTLRSQKLRMLLTHRKLLQSKAIASGVSNVIAQPPPNARGCATCPPAAPAANPADARTRIRFHKTPSPAGKNREDDRRLRAIAAKVSHRSAKTDRPP